MNMSSLTYCHNEKSKSAEISSKIKEAIDCGEAISFLHLSIFTLALTLAAFIWLHYVQTY